MKALQIFFGMGVAVALLGASVAVAEIRHESIMEPIRFSVSTEDGFITLPDITFCDINTFSGEEAQSTCLATPGGPAPDMLMELPAIPSAVPAARYTSAQAAIAPVSLLRSPSPPRERPLRGGGGGGTGGGGGGNPPIEIIPEPPPPEDPPYVIPEPATLVIISLGIGGAVAARRWRKA